MIADFEIKNKLGKPRYFQEMFLIANTKIKIVLKNFFFKFSNAYILFSKKTLKFRFYIIKIFLSITKQVYIINKKNFVIIVLDANSKTFIIYMLISFCKIIRYNWKLKIRPTIIFLLF